MLLRYFKRIEPKKSEKIDAILPETDNPLATLIPTSAIQAANTGNFYPLGEDRQNSDGYQ